MNNLIMYLAGMSLIINRSDRSEVMLVRTAGNDHSHLHVLVTDEDAIRLDQSTVVWIEQDTNPLSGPMVDAAEHLLRLHEAAPGASLRSELNARDPGQETAWRDFVDVWIELPGGELTTEPTSGPGGQLPWEFPNTGGHPAMKRVLTQFATLIRDGVTGQLRVAVKKGNEDTTYLNLHQNSGGDFEMLVATLFTGPPVDGPKPGDRVELSEIQLLYNCLQPSKGPIPFISSWPVPTRPSQLEPKWRMEGRIRTVIQGRVNILTDPATGICPPGGITV